jgi:hypothetical protein
LPAGKNAIMEAKHIVGICHQETAGEDIANWEDLQVTQCNRMQKYNITNWEDFMYAVVIVIVGVCNLVRLP